MPLRFRLAAAAVALYATAPHALTTVARADAHDGRVIHSHGAVLAVADGKGYSPFAPDRAIAEPPGETIAEDPLACRDLVISSPEVPAAENETVAAIEHGALPGIKDATVMLVRGRREDDIFEYAVLTVRVYDGRQLKAEAALDVVAYPCALVIDDLDGKPGNEIAVAWISLGGSGHTAGVSVLSVR